jgi:hypothetical protein
MASAMGGELSPSEGIFARVGKTLTESGESVLKLTKPGIFGEFYFLEDGRVNQRCCTPGDYPARQGLRPGEMYRVRKCCVLATVEALPR